MIQPTQLIPTIEHVLTAAIEDLPECEEQIVLLTLLANRKAGIGNRAAMEFCAGLAKTALGEPVSPWFALAVSLVTPAPEAEATYPPMTVKDI